MPDNDKRHRGARIEGAEGTYNLFRKSIAEAIKAKAYPQMKTKLSKLYALPGSTKDPRITDEVRSHQICCLSHAKSLAQLAACCRACELLRQRTDGTHGSR